MGSIKQCSRQHGLPQKGIRTLDLIVEVVANRVQLPSYGAGFIPSPWKSEIRKATAQLPFGLKLCRGFGLMTSALQLRFAGILSPEWARARWPDDPSLQRRWCLALSARDKLLMAIARQDFTTLPRLLDNVAKLDVSRDIVGSTGLGHILADGSLWRKAQSETVAAYAQKVLQRWRDLPKSEGTLKNDQVRLKGFRYTDLSAQLRAWTAYFLHSSSIMLPVHHIERVSFVLITAGFASPSSVVGLMPAELDEWFDESAERNIVRHAIDKMSSRASSMAATFSASGDAITGTGCSAC